MVFTSYRHHCRLPKNARAIIHASYMGWTIDILDRLQFAFGTRVQAELVFSLLAVSLFSLVFRFRPAWRDFALAYFRRIAARPYLPYVIAGLFPVCLRLLAIYWRSVPEPLMHDEFNRLLVAFCLFKGSRLRASDFRLPVGRCAARG